MRLCRPLLDGSIGTEPWFHWVRASADSLASAHATEILLAAGYCFRTTGELREELLPVLWDPLGLHRDDYGSVLLLLCQSGVLFLAEHTEHGRRWVMPRRLSESPPAAAIEQWSRSGGGKGVEKEMLSLVYNLGLTPPPGLAERLMAACYGIGQYKAFWKRGAIMETRLGRAHLLIELRAVRERRKAPRRPKAPPKEQAEERAEGKQGPQQEEAGGGRAGGGGAASDADDEEDVGPHAYDYSYELALETRGPRAQRSEIWGLLLRLRPRVEKLLSEWPDVPCEPKLCCPSCMIAGRRPSRWPADAAQRAQQLVPIVPTCPNCEQPVDLVGISAAESYPEAKLSLSMPPEVERGVPPNPAPMKLGQPVQASMSLPRLLGVDKRRIEELLAFPPEAGNGGAGVGAGVGGVGAAAGAAAAAPGGGGGGGGGEAAAAPGGDAAAGAGAGLSAAAAEREQRMISAIVSEIEGFDCPSVDPRGWTDRDWLRYLLEGTAEEASLPEGMPSETLDRGHAGMRLDDFVAHPMAVAAGLGRAHALVLRLATSSAFRRITGPLFVGCSESKPHPYPATVAVLSEAITALQRGAALSEAEEADAAREEAAKALAEAEAADGGTFQCPPLLPPPPPPRTIDLWRGVSNMEVTEELLERGGTLIAPTSLSTDRSMAIETACACHSRRNGFPPCLLKIKSGGATSGEAMAAVDIRFLSLYPLEAQYLLPPGVHLHCQLGEAEIFEEELESGEPGPLLVQLELVPTPLKGAWVPREHEVQRALAIHAESGGKLLTPRGGGALSTPRAGAGGLGGLMSPRLSTPRGGLGLSTPRQGAAAPSAEPAVGLW